MFYHWRSPWHCSNDVIPDYCLRCVDCSLESCAASSGLTSGGSGASDSLHPTRPDFLSPSSSSHSRFSTAGCCSKAASWRLDAWLPRWLRMLLQDPRENQEVVTSLRGELLLLVFLFFLFLHFVSAHLDYEMPGMGHTERRECFWCWLWTCFMLMCAFTFTYLRCHTSRSRYSAGFS